MSLNEFSIKVEYPNVVAYIYRISNIDTNMCYVGQTKRAIDVRIIEHLTGDGSKLLLKDIVINSIKKFKFEVLDIIYDTECNIDDREHHFIQKYNSLHPDGFNLRLNKSLVPNDNDVDLANIEIGAKYCFTDEENYKCFSIGEFTACRAYQDLINIKQATNTEKMIRKKNLGFNYLQLRVKTDDTDYMKSQMYNLVMKYDGDEFISF